MAQRKVKPGDLPEIKDVFPKRNLFQKAVKDETSAAIVFQRFFRKHHIKPLAHLESYHTLVIGNDPELKLDNYKSRKNKRIGLVATGGMRAVQIACELANQNEPKLIPKVFLIDNSFEVHQFWSHFRKWMKNCKDPGQFFAELPMFLKRNGRYINDFQDAWFPISDKSKTLYPSQNTPKFFEKLFKFYGYDYVRAIILQASCIKQSWTDKPTFEKLKVNFSFLKISDIYMYASNIAHSIQAMKYGGLDSLLTNIALLNPILSIHTNLCKHHRMPEDVYLLEDSHPEKLKEILLFENGSDCSLDSESEISDSSSDSEYSEVRSDSELSIGSESSSGYADRSLGWTS